MKQLLNLVGVGVAVLVLSGCKGGAGSDVNYLLSMCAPDGEGGVAYVCTSGFSGTTDSDGAFEFDPSNDACTFDISHWGGQSAYISNEVGNGNGLIDGGVTGLPYSCTPSGKTGLTGFNNDDGRFDYTSGDTCTIYY
jgi:hypothetical protein